MNVKSKPRYDVIRAHMAAETMAAVTSSGMLAAFKDRRPKAEQQATTTPGKGKAQVSCREFYFYLYVPVVYW